MTLELFLRKLILWVSGANVVLFLTLIIAVNFIMAQYLDSVPIVYIIAMMVLTDAAAMPIIMHLYRVFMRGWKNEKSSLSQTPKPESPSQK